MTVKNNDGIFRVSDDDDDDDDDGIMMVSVIPNNISSDQDDENIKITHDNQNQNNPRTIIRTQTTQTQTQTRKCSTITSKICILFFFALASLPFISISFSVDTIYSCKFLSYRDITSTTAREVFMEAFLNNNKNNNLNINNNLNNLNNSDYVENNNLKSGGWVYRQDPGGNLSSLSSSVGSSSSSFGKFFKQDPMCVVHRDQLHNFKSFFDNYSNYNDYIKDESSLSSSDSSRKIDIWILARYCSIIAPYIGILGIIQLLYLTFNYHCGGGINNKFATKRSKFLLFITYVIASVFQFSAFTIMIASPQLLSFIINDEVTQEQFCSFSFSSTIESTSRNNNSIICRFDSGAWLSPGAGIGYFIIAFITLFIIPLLFYKTSTSTSITTTGIHSDSDNNNKVCCGLW